MKIKASIVPLVFVFTLIAGDANEDSVVTLMPHLQFDQWNRAFYSCQFNFPARCVWKHNGNNINIYDYGYTWKVGNGYNTYDCSIEAKWKYPRKLSDESTGTTVECIGVRIGNGPRKVSSDSSDSRVIRTPQFEQSLDRSLYLCKFNFEVQCRWKVNDDEIDIVKYGYTWMTGNGSNTDDCSIETKSRPPLKLSDDRSGATVECIGRGPRKVMIGSPINLQCPGVNRGQCRWIRDSKIISMNNEYSYAGEKGCRIRINQIKRADLTQWNCYDMTSPQRPRATYALVEQNLTDPSSSTTVENSPKASTTSTTPTIMTTETGAIYSPIKTSETATTISTDSNDDQSMTLTVIVVVAVVVTCAIAFVMATIIYYLRRRKNLKDKRPAPDEPKYNPISFNAKSEDILCPGSISESNYMTLSGPFAPPSQKTTSNRPPPRNINNVDQSNDAIYADVNFGPTASCPVEVTRNNADDVTYADVIIGQRSPTASRGAEAPRNNVDDVTYADVIIGQRSPTASRAVPHNNVGDVTYAVVMPKRH